MQLKWNGKISSQDRLFSIVMEHKKLDFNKIQQIFLSNLRRNLFNHTVRNSKEKLNIIKKLKFLKLIMKQKFQLIEGLGI